MGDAAGAPLGVPDHEGILDPSRRFALCSRLVWAPSCIAPVVLGANVTAAGVPWPDAASIAASWCARSA